MMVWRESMDSSRAKGKVDASFSMRMKFLGDQILSYQYSR